MFLRSGVVVAALLLAAAHPATAQIYQWKDASGRTIISDKPPPSDAAQARTLSSEAPRPAAAPSGQKSLAERDLQFRKRQADAREQAEKEQKESAANTQRKENCEKAKRYLAVLESGERVVTRSADGERQFLDDAQRQREIAETKKSIDGLCK